MRRKLIDVAIAVAIVLAVVVLYRKVTRLWWIWDDAWLLNIASEHSLGDYFAGTMWRSLPLFTPLQAASYDAELSLFGLNPVPFHVVHLVVLAGVAVGLFFVLRFWLSRAAAAAAAFLFLAGTPVAVMASQLMLMHYVESTLLAIGSVALFARRRRWASAVLYLLAMLAKEIAIPLPLVLLVLPERNLRARLRDAWPHGIALIAYFGWRWAVLGKVLGGPGLTFSAAEAPGLVVRTAANLVRTLAGPQLAAGAVLAVLLIIGIVLAMGLRALIAFAAAVAPIIPVAVHYENRFAWAFWLCVVVVFAAGVDSLRNRRVAIALLIATPLLGLVVNRQQWKIEYSLAKRMSDEARIYSYLRAGDWLRMPAIPPGEMYQLAAFCQHMLGRPEGALWFGDDLYLCSGRKLQRVFGYDERTREVRELTAELPAIAARYCASIRPGAPLQLHFHVDAARRLLTWDLGPYDDGYTVVTGDGWNAYPVRRHDGLQLFGEKTLSFRVRYRAPQGWVTYSPELSIDLTRDQDLVWRR